MKHEHIFSLIKEQKWDNIEALINNYNKESSDEIDFNIMDETGNYILHYFITFNQRKLIKLIVNLGARLDIVDNDGRSIIYYAIKSPWNDMLSFLILLNNESIGIPIIDIKDYKGNIPLHYAIEFKNIQAITNLIQYGSNIHTKDNNGNNALHNAVLSNNIDIIKLILKSNPNPNSFNNNRETPLHLAVMNKNLNIVEILLSHNKTDINIQNSINEHTPLNYAINLHHDEISNLLLNSTNLNINIQDLEGNTYLHYIILETQYKLLNTIINKSNLNYNLFNIDGKLPVHLLFDLKDDIRDEYLMLMIPYSNLNFQDKDGNSVLMLLCKYNLWKKYKNLLERKKLDIYLENNYGENSLNFIHKNELNEFMTMVATSYLYQLKSIDSNHKLLCNSDDECIELMIKKINETKISHPYAEIDIKTENDNDNSMCVYTGATIDVLLGINYLLRKYKNVVSTLTLNFYYNQEMIEFYRKNGININPFGEFMNFEIIWLNKQLFFTQEFDNQLLKAFERKDKRFIIMSLGIETKKGSHANFLILDKNTNEIERFEPNGSSSPYGLDYHNELLDEELRNKFNKFDKKIKLITPKEYLPKIGFQYLDAVENKKNIGDPRGFCSVWTIWYAEQRITNPDVLRNTLVLKLINDGKKKKISFRKMIRNYSNRITLIRDKIFNKINLNINQWINKELSQEHINKIISELKKIFYDVVL
jgi:ankyrin repeat protein